MLKLNALIPELSVTDLEKSLDFYVKNLGFKVEYRREEDRFVFISLGEAQIVLEEGRDDRTTGEPHYLLGRGVNISIEVKGLDAIIEELARDNVQVKKEAEERWYRFKGKLLGEKQILVVDPDGYNIRLMEDLGEKEIKK